GVRVTKFWDRKRISACCLRKAHVGACSLVDVEGGENRRIETRCFRWRQSRRASASQLFLARRRLELHHILRGEKCAAPGAFAPSSENDPCAAERTTPFSKPRLVPRTPVRFHVATLEQEAGRALRARCFLDGARGRPFDAGGTA